MPEWVQRPRMVVSATEDFLLWVFGQTGSPEALGSRVALAWLGGLDDQTSPMIHRPAEPTQQRALTEFLITYPISTGEPYPAAQWFTEQGLALDDVPTRAFWDAHASYESTRSYARGVSIALGWALGAIDDPTLMTPLHCEDGTTIPDDERLECARMLHTLSVRPLPPPPRPHLSPRRAAGPIAGSPEPRGVLRLRSQAGNDHEPTGSSS